MDCYYSCLLGIRFDNQFGGIPFEESGSTVNNQLEGFSLDRLSMLSKPCTGLTYDAWFDAIDDSDLCLRQRACIYNRHLHTYIHTYIHTYKHTYIHTYIHTYKHTYIHTYKHTYIHTYIHTYKHTYIHTYVHTYICTYIAQCINLAAE